MFVNFILILIIPPSVNRSGQKLRAEILTRFSTKIFLKIPQQEEIKLFETATEMEKYFWSYP